MRSAALIVPAVFIATVVAQKASGVPDATKLGWCNGQHDACNQLCSNNINDNTCDVTSLAYKCTCGDGTTPDLSQYTGTIPYFLCQQGINSCVSANTTSATNQAACRKIKCGSKDPAKAVQTSTSATQTATSTSSSASRTATATVAANTTVPAAAPNSGMMNGVSVGTGVFVAALAAGFALLL